MKSDTQRWLTRHVIWALPISLSLAVPLPALAVNIWNTTAAVQTPVGEGFNWPETDPNESWFRYLLFDWPTKPVRALPIYFNNLDHESAESWIKRYYCRKLIDYAETNPENFAAPSTVLLGHTGGPRLPMAASPVASSVIVPASNTKIVAPSTSPTTTPVATAPTTAPVTTAPTTAPAPTTIPSTAPSTEPISRRRRARGVQTQTSAPPPATIRLPTTRASTAVTTEIPVKASPHEEKERKTLRNFEFTNESAKLSLDSCRDLLRRTGTDTWKTEELRAAVMEQIAALPKGYWNKTMHTLSTDFATAYEMAPEAPELIWEESQSIITEARASSEADFLQEKRQKANCYAIWGRLKTEVFHISDADYDVGKKEREDLCSATSLWGHAALYSVGIATFIKFFGGAVPKGANRLVTKFTGRPRPYEPSRVTSLGGVFGEALEAAKNRPSLLGRITNLFSGTKQNQIVQGVTGAAEAEVIAEVANAPAAPKVDANLTAEEIRAKLLERKSPEILEKLQEIEDLIIPMKLTESDAQKLFADFLATLEASERTAGEALAAEAATPPPAGEGAAPPVAAAATPSAAGTTTPPLAAAAVAAAATPAAERSGLIVRGVKAGAKFTENWLFKPLGFATRVLTTWTWRNFALRGAAATKKEYAKLIATAVTAELLYIIQEQRMRVKQEPFDELRGMQSSLASYALIPALKERVNELTDEGKFVDEIAKESKNFQELSDTRLSQLVAYFDIHYWSYFARMKRQLGVLSALTTRVGQREPNSRVKPSDFGAYTDLVTEAETQTEAVKRGFAAELQRRADAKASAMSSEAEKMLQGLNGANSDPNVPHDAIKDVKGLKHEPVDMSKLGNATLTEGMKALKAHLKNLEEEEQERQKQAQQSGTAPSP